MKFDCSNISDLSSALVTVTKSAARVSAYRIQSRDGTLTLSAVSEHQTMHQHVEGVASGDGCYLFAGTPDAGLLKGYDGPCAVSASDTHLTVSHGGHVVASYAIVTEVAPPTAATPTPIGTVVIPASTLKTILTRCLKTAGDTLRQEVVAMDLSPSDGRVAVTVVSTDSIRLTLCQLVADGSVPAPVQLIARAGGLKGLLKVLPKAGAVHVQYDAGHVCFAAGQWVLRLVRSVDRFPHYASILPKSHPCAWEADAASLSTALKAIMPAAKANSRACRTTFELVPETRELILQVRNVANGVDLERRVPLLRLDGVDAKTQRLVFNASYFQDFLAGQSHKAVRVGWTSGTYPATLSPLEQSADATYTVILMPITR